MSSRCPQANSNVLHMNNDNKNPFPSVVFRWHQTNISREAVFSLNSQNFHLWFLLAGIFDRYMCQAPVKPICLYSWSSTALNSYDAHNRKLICLSSTPSPPVFILKKKRWGEKILLPRDVSLMSIKHYGRKRIFTIINSCEGLLS